MTAKYFLKPRSHTNACGVNLKQYFNENKTIYSVQANMNIEEIPSTVCKKRFKGLENFLRRVAFNLGKVCIYFQLFSTTAA